MSHRRVWRLALVAAILSMPIRVEAATLLVSNYGSDLGACGGKATPCRSISRAIVGAAAGDKIVVGPGHYGDLDGDGTLGELGEESASPDGLIVVDRTVSIESRDGARATIIDAAGSGQNVVAIKAPGVIFGKPKKGFLVRGGALGVSAIADRVVVSGNRAIANGTGILIFGTGFVMSGNQALGNSSCGCQISGAGRVAGNELLQNGQGGLCSFIGTYEIVGNTATNNGVGGISVGGSGNLVQGNVASDNEGFGFELAGLATITGNVAARNGDDGFFLNGGAHTFTGNSAIGNRLYGVEIPVGGGTVRLSKNNFFGNDRGVGGLGCGLYNFASNSVDATGNFWGAATGPGPDPADLACNDPSGVILTFEPFATKELKVKTKPPSVQ